MNNKIQIAIDGPVAAGKSAVARALANKLGYVYVDTGAMYRAVALFIERAGISWENESAIGSRLDEIKIRLARPVGKKKDGRPVSVYLGNEDISWTIRNNHIAEGASVVSQYKKVRENLVKRQQKMAQNGSVVMEGRDIGIRVLPKANLKIFMTADVDTRVWRKWNYLKRLGMKMTKKQVKADLIRRDEREMSREIDPLKPTAESWKLDTTGMTIDGVVDIISAKVAELK